MKPRLSLEEHVNGLKSRLEESEYKHAVVCEALENLLESNPTNASEWRGLRQAALWALKGVKLIVKRNNTW